MFRVSSDVMVKSHGGHSSRLTPAAKSDEYERLCYYGACITGPFYFEGITKMDEEKNEEMEALESEARDDARADRYDDSEIRGMLSSVLEKLDSIADGMKALFVTSPVAEVEETEDEESYSIEDLEF